MNQRRVRAGIRFLEQAGLNLVTVLDCAALPEATGRIMRESGVPLSVYRRLVLLGHGGKRMWQALHFQPRPAQESVVRQIRSYLRPGGHLILVEYDTDQGNPWVPYPLSFSTWQALAERCGFGSVSLLAARPSRFLGLIYAAVSTHTE
jgi:hypothetical protein